jgi:hypothetical protein
MFSLWARSLSLKRENSISISASDSRSAQTSINVHSSTFRFNSLDSIFDKVREWGDTPHGHFTHPLQIPCVLTVLCSVLHTLPFSPPDAVPSIEELRTVDRKQTGPHQCPLIL